MAKARKAPRSLQQTVTRQPIKPVALPRPNPVPVGPAPIKPVSRRALEKRHQAAIAARARREARKEFTRQKHAMLKQVREAERITRRMNQIAARNERRRLLEEQRLAKRKPWSKPRKPPVRREKTEGTIKPVSLLSPEERRKRMREGGDRYRQQVREIQRGYGLRYRDAQDLLREFKRRKKEAERERKKREREARRKLKKKNPKAWGKLQRSRRKKPWAMSKPGQKRPGRKLGAKRKRDFDYKFPFGGNKKPKRNRNKRKKSYYKDPILRSLTGRLVKINKVSDSPDTWQCPTTSRRAPNKYWTVIHEDGPPPLPPDGSWQEPPPLPPDPSLPPTDWTKPEMVVRVVSTYASSGWSSWHGSSGGISSVEFYTILPYPYGVYAVTSSGNFSNPIDNGNGCGGIQTGGDGSIVFLRADGYLARSYYSMDGGITLSWAGYISSTFIGWGYSFETRWNGEFCAFYYEGWAVRQTSYSFSPVRMVDGSPLPDPLPPMPDQQFGGWSSSGGGGGAAWQCDCPDFTKQAARANTPLYFSEMSSGNWVGSQAGAQAAGDPPSCKHIKAAKREIYAFMPELEMLQARDKKKRAKEDLKAARQRLKDFREAERQELRNLRLRNLYPEKYRKGKDEKRETTQAFRNRQERAAKVREVLKAEYTAHLRSLGLKPRTGKGAPKDGLYPEQRIAQRNYVRNRMAELRPGRETVAEKNARLDKMRRKAAFESKQQREILESIGLRKSRSKTPPLPKVSRLPGESLAEAYEAAQVQRAYDRLKNPKLKPLPDRVLPQKVQPPEFGTPQAESADARAREFLYQQRSARIGLPDASKTPNIHYPISRIEESRKAREARQSTATRSYLKKLFPRLR